MSRPTPASAPRPSGGVRGHTTGVAIAVTAAAAVAVATLPSDRPCPATGRPRQGLRRSRAAHTRHRAAHTHATRQPRPTGVRARAQPRAARLYPFASPVYQSAGASRKCPKAIAAPSDVGSVVATAGPGPPTRLSAEARLGDTRPPRAFGHPFLIDNSGTRAPPPQPPRRSPPTHRAGRARRRPTAAVCTSTERISSAKRGCDSPTSSSTRRQNPPRPHTCGASTDLVRPSLSVPT